VFPSEPPLAGLNRQNGAQQARARGLGAAERTLAGEHHSGIRFGCEGRREGNTRFPLVGSEFPAGRTYNLRRREAQFPQRLGSRDPAHRRRRTIAQGTVRADRVVVLPPHFHDHLRFFQRIEDLPVQAFIPQLSVKRFAVAVLPRAAGSMNIGRVPTVRSHCCTRRAVISAPVSLHTYSGTPLWSMPSPSVSITCVLLSRRATRIARHSRVNSSIITSSRKLRPSCVRASTKS